MKKLYTIILAALLITASCYTQKPRRTKTNASKYNPASFVLHPQFKLFHESDTYSKLYFKLFTKELLYSRANEKREHQARIKIKYQILESLRNHNILDSAQSTITVKHTENQTSIISFLKLKRYDLPHYIINIKIIDLYANKKSHSFVRVDNTKNNNEQNYLSLKSRNKKPIFTEYFQLNDPLTIRYKNPAVKKFTISHFNSDFPEADKPSNTTQTNISTLSRVSSKTVQAEKGEIIFKENKKGIYLIKADTMKQKGMLKVNFDNSYPLITKSQDLIEATKYLLTDEEYARMKQSDNKKLSIDNFWLQATQNKERAREILKIWYNRASYSNYFFTSYKEGWKTDRGMIYMVYGPPDDINNFDDAEKWIYLNTKEDKKLEFIFVIPEQTISGNDFVLLRKTDYLNSWNRAIKSWRAGTVYRY